ncbi:MAG: hypothetical protein II767_10945 [Proteobacteria bacterium]|jgi:hypothetical protein|nr:hypothetical protein [Pseudomonadota bacterium]
MANLDTTAIENEKKALQLLADEIQKATDDDTREMLAAEIQKTAEKLEKLCAELQAEADKLAPPEEDDLTNAVVEVILTKEQRQRVFEKTGIDVPSVRIPDPTADLTKNMSIMQPEFVEECAITQAESFKRLVADAEEAAEKEEADDGDDNQ